MIAPARSDSSFPIAFSTRTPSTSSKIPRLRPLIATRSDPVGRPRRRMNEDSRRRDSPERF